MRIFFGLDSFVCLGIQINRVDEMKSAMLSNKPKAAPILHRTYADQEMGSHRLSALCRLQRSDRI